MRCYYLADCKPLSTLSLIIPPYLRASAHILITLAQIYAAVPPQNQARFYPGFPLNCVGDYPWSNPNGLLCYP